ncbi:MAG: hypothetical protein R3246_16505, partial [Acidimicrobiia bacterium]|nr:hypothetical protein [Acidimicrobiia bacterium]
MCLLDHRVDPATIEETSGRRLRATARRRRGTHAPRQVTRRQLPSISLDPAPLPGTVAVLERVEPVKDVEWDDADDDHVESTVTTPMVESRPAPAPERRYAPVTDSDTLSLTGLLVEELWNLGPDEDIEGWTPGEMDSTLVHSGVRKRKIVAIVFLVALVAAAGWRALTWGDAQTATAIDTVTTESARLVGHLEALEPVIADLADGTIDSPLEASAALGGLDESARRLFAVAGDLPTDSDLAPVRELAVAQSSGALDLGTTIAESAAYASAIDLITRPLELPTATDIDGLTVVTAEVSGWVTDFQSGVASL